MHVRRDKIAGPHRVSEDLLLQGMITGDATVASGVTLDLQGTVTGDLHVEPGARVMLRGTVSGSVVNHGKVDVEGVIYGKLTDLDGGTSHVAPNAVIRNEH
jgi:cytoskeletal protein CcmA (bactofilin family)